MGSGPQSGAARRTACALRLATVHAVIAAAFLTPLQANQYIGMAEGAGAEIEFIEHLQNAPPTGWLPVGLRITNRAPIAREWRVRFDCDVGRGADQLGEWLLRVPASETRAINLFVPQPWFPTDSVYFQIRGRVTGPGVASGWIYINRSFTGVNQTRYTGMSHALAAENWSRLEAELDPGAASGAGPRSIELAGTRFDPAHLPADWRTWSGCATVWLHRDDWIGLGGVQRLALLRWVAQGGDLFLAGSGSGLDDLPSAGHRWSGNFIDGGDAAWPLAAYGLGQIHRVPLGAQSEPGSRLPIAKVAATIQAHRITSPALAQLSSAIGTTQAEAALGVIRPGGPMLGWLIAAIAILLGPVNIFLLAPAHRRARLFITVPVISLGGAVALVALILLQDGTGGHGQRGVLVTLLPDRPEALVLQEQCAMTGLLFARDFSLPEDTAFIDYTQNQTDRPYHPTPQRTARTGLDRAGSRMTGEWFTSRTVHAHHARAFVPTRATLTLTSSGDGPPTVVSTCPGVLRDLIVNDAAGVRWWASEVPPGHSVELEPAGSLMIGRWIEPLRHFGVSLAAAALREEPPLSFHASADSWDETVPVPTLPSVRWRDDRIFVTGSVREAKP